ncbi:unnamed protein product [Ilex paraguariensis]|uniref:Uncharacterized protein n=1 Tax=Ilex paraguariensis TaxID=185542 RepID=A0ABC8UQW7_9AQUA
MGVSVDRLYANCSASKKAQAKIENLKKQVQECEKTIGAKFSRVGTKLEFFFQQAFVLTLLSNKEEDKAKGDTNIAREDLPLAVIPISNRDETEWTLTAASKVAKAKEVAKVISVDGIK